MKKSEKLKLLKNVVVTEPCTVGWETMPGDEKVRRCDQCNLNVHNISAMSSDEAAVVLKRRQTTRTCVFMCRRKDGSVITDNCPQRLRKIINKVAVAVAAVLMIMASAITQSAIAHGGLVGAAIDPAFGQSNEVGLLADYGYDTARDISRVLTWITFAIVFLIPMSKKRKYTIRRTILELVALGSVPLLVHLAGTFAINNFGGLGGGM